MTAIVILSKHEKIQMFNQRKGKLWNVYTVKYSSSVERNEMLLTGNNVEDSPKHYTE